MFCLFFSAKTPVPQNKSGKRRVGNDIPVVPISLTCPGCGMEFKSSSVLHNHVRDAHFDNPLVVCSHDDCEETFNIQNIKEHEEDYHPEIGEMCELCNTAFRSKSQLLEHVKEHMVGNASFACDYANCDYTNSNPSKMIEHKTVAHQIHLKRIHRCPVPECGKNFSDSSSLQAHVATHPDRNTLRFVCNFPGCKASFRRRRFLDAHKEKHTLNGETEPVEEPENDENLNYSTEMEYMDSYMEDKASFDRNYSGSAELYEIRDTVDEEGNSQREVFLCVNKGQANEGIQPMASAPGKFYLFFF